MSGKRGTFEVRRQKVGLVCKVLCASHFINFSTKAECVVFFFSFKKGKKKVLRLEGKKKRKKKQKKKK